MYFYYDYIIINARKDSNDDGDVFKDANNNKMKQKNKIHSTSNQLGLSSNRNQNDCVGHEIMIMMVKRNEIGWTSVKLMQTHTHAERK